MISIIFKFIGKHWVKIDAYVLVALMYFFIVVPNNKKADDRIDEKFDQLVNIASQPRYSISNDFEKMRTRDNAPINLNLSNELQDNHIELSDSTVKEEVKKGLFKRIFKKK